MGLWNKIVGFNVKEAYAGDPYYEKSLVTRKYCIGAAAVGGAGIVLKLIGEKEVSKYTILAGLAALLFSYAKLSHEHMHAQISHTPGQDGELISDALVSSIHE
jgi:hypothetical protein